jgi:tetratricopeptide (TPR) repeat protein
MGFFFKDEHDLNDLGLKALEEAKLEQAQDFFLKAIEKNALPTFFWNLGYTQYYMGAMDAAIANIQVAAEHEVPMAMNFLLACHLNDQGIDALNAEDHHSAESFFDQAFDTCPIPQISYLWNLGYTQLHIEEHQDVGWQNIQNAANHGEPNAIEFLAQYEAQEQEESSSGAGLAVAGLLLDIGLSLLG